jgi:integrase
MSVYFDKKKKWWKYEFRYLKQRYTKSGFETKKEALAAEAEKRKEAKNPKKMVSTDMAFLELVNCRLDYLQAYKSNRHYTDTVYLCKRWIKQWGNKSIKQITSSMIQSYLINIKNKKSAYTANKELRSLRSTFNFGIKLPNKWFETNPTDGIIFFPVENKKKYVPPVSDVLRVMLAAEEDVQDYLWTIALTLGRMSEINRLEWKDVDFENKFVTLYTRKTKGGNLKPRDIPMTDKLYKTLQKRFCNRDNQWVFHHTYFSRKANKWMTGPYQDRKKIMKTLCNKAGVKYFRFHPLRHFGASILEKSGVPTKVIQDLLGHENRTTTEIYLHSFSGADRTAMNFLETTLNQTQKGAR